MQTVARPAPAPELRIPRLPAKRPTNEATLLPSVLAGPAAMLWLWVPPIAVLLRRNGQGYWLIEGNMNDAQRSRALWLGLAGGVNLLAGIALYFVARALEARRASAILQISVRSAPALLIQ